jgi:CRISPR/Cas system-associated exonuclease Cas4 (RecB family)
MKFTQNIALRERFLSGLRAERGSHVGIHVTDLVYCLRQAFYRKTQPKTPTDVQLGYFLDGACRHRALQSLINVESEVHVSGLGVTGSIDIMDKIPVEFKSTRGKGVPDHYYRQLGYYCILTNNTRGILVIQRINDKMTPFEFIDVELEPSDVENLRREIMERRSALEIALDSGSPDGLIHIAEPWKCETCQYRVECQPDQLPNPVTSVWKQIPLAFRGPKTHE